MEDTLSNLELSYLLEGERKSHQKEGNIQGKWNEKKEESWQFRIGTKGNNQSAIKIINFKSFFSYKWKFDT